MCVCERVYVCVRACHVRVSIFLRALQGGGGEGEGEGGGGGGDHVTLVGDIFRHLDSVSRLGVYV